MTIPLKPHEYQVKAIEFAISCGRSYCALDMGLGKSLVALEFAKHAIKDTASGVLIVAPLRTVYSSWPEEIAKWTPALSSVTLHGPLKVAAIRKRANLYLINYEGLPWLLEELKEIFRTTKRLPIRTIILDEGSMVKSSSTKRFRALKTLVDIAPKYRLILSGTPAPNSLMDLWAQYYLLDKGARLETAFTRYKNKYFYAVDGEAFVWRIKPGVADEIYNKVADITYRLAAEDYLKLPHRIDNIIHINISKEVFTQYKELEKEFFLKIEDAEFEAMSAPSLAMKLRQLVQGGLYLDEEKVKGERPYRAIHTAKLDALASLMEEANGQGILCAIQFRFELNMIQKKFPGAPYIARGVSATTSAYLISEWNKGNIPLLLCHPASLSHGVNLQYGSHIIVWYGLTWSLEQYLQFNARLHRQNQKNAVIVHHLVAKGTIDERVMKALKHKFKNQQEFLEFLKGYR